MIFGVLNPEQIWHQQLVHLPTSPVHCSHFTLWNPKKVIFQQYYSYILQIIYVISEENKPLPPYPPHPKNITALPCKMQNSFIQTLVALKRTGCDVTTGMSGKQRHSKCSKWPLSARIHMFPVFFATDQLQLLCWKSAHVATRRFRNSSVMRIGTRQMRSCICRRHGLRSGLLAGHMSGLMNCVSHSTEARLCHEHDVHCLAGRQTRLQQCCWSLVAASATVTCLADPLSFARGWKKRTLVQPSLDTARAHVSNSNRRYRRVAEASWCDMGWFSAERGGMQHYLQSDKKSLAFYKVVQWYFSGVVGKGVTVCFLLR